jgi:hypothetical protein
LATALPNLQYQIRRSGLTIHTTPPTLSIH